MNGKLLTELEHDEHLVKQGGVDNSVTPEWLAVA